MRVSGEKSTCCDRLKMKNDNGELMSTWILESSSMIIAGPRELARVSNSLSSDRKCGQISMDGRLIEGTMELNRPVSGLKIQMTLLHGAHIG